MSTEATLFSKAIRNVLVKVASITEKLSDGCHCGSQLMMRDGVTELGFLISMKKIEFSNNRDQVIALMPLQQGNEW